MRFAMALSDKLNFAVKYFSLVLLVIMTVLIVLQVFFRYVVGSTLVWSEELARYIFIWIVLLGATIGVKEGFHVSVNFITDRLNYSLKQITVVISQVMIFIFSAVMIYYGTKLAQNVAYQLSPAVRLSMFWVYLVLPVSGALIMIHNLAIIPSAIKKVFSSDQEAHDEGGEG